MKISGENGYFIVELDKQDVESAIRQFIVSCNPRLAAGYRVNPAGHAGDRDEFMFGGRFIFTAKEAATA